MSRQGYRWGQDEEEKRKKSRVDAERRRRGRERERECGGGATIWYYMMLKTQCGWRTVEISARSSKKVSHAKKFRGGLAVRTRNFEDPLFPLSLPFWELSDLNDSQTASFPPWWNCSESAHALCSLRVGGASLSELTRAEKALEQCNSPRTNSQMYSRKRVLAFFASCNLH